MKHHTNLCEVAKVRANQGATADSLCFKWVIPNLFLLYFRLFYTAEINKVFNKNFDDDWIGSADLWGPFYQLSNNHCKVFLCPS